MQELLGRLRALDPSAEVSLRVIACFDELIVGCVSSRALLAASAALAGCVAGYSREEPHRLLRVSPSGDPLPTPAPDGTPPRSQVAQKQGVTVWLERQGAPYPNDALIVERLLMALIIRHDRSGFAGSRRDLAILMDDSVPTAARREAALRQGLSTTSRYRVLTAPLFATWQHHPPAREDVVATPFGPLHTLIVADTFDAVKASPVGIGCGATIDDLPRSFATSVVALRLCRLPGTPSVLADEYGGLLDVLSDVQSNHQSTDLSGIDAVAEHTWGSATLDALVKADSVRDAARRTGVHHSTMTARVGVVTDALGYDPLVGVGRVRLGVAFLLWRLRNSTALSLPAPTSAEAASSPELER